MAKQQKKTNEQIHPCITNPNPQKHGHSDIEQDHSQGLLRLHNTAIEFPLTRKVVQWGSSVGIVLVLGGLPVHVPWTWHLLSLRIHQLVQNILGGQHPVGAVGPSLGLLPQVAGTVLQVPQARPGSTRVDVNVSVCFHSIALHHGLEIAVGGGSWMRAVHFFRARAARAKQKGWLGGQWLMGNVNQEVIDSLKTQTSNIHITSIKLVSTKNGGYKCNLQRKRILLNIDTQPKKR